MPPEYMAALEGVRVLGRRPSLEYVRDIVHDHILERGGAFRERGGAFRERGGALRALSNAGKAWVIAYRECVAVAASLPDKESLTATWGRGCRPTQPLRVKCL